MWLFSAVVSLLTTNLIFTKALGTSTLMAATKNRSSLAILAVVMTCFAAASSLLTNLVFNLFRLTILLQYPYNLGLPLVYTAVISVIYLVALLLTHVLFRKRFTNYKKYVHLAAFNCAVMGTLYLAFEPVQFLNGLQLRTDSYVLGSIFADTTHPIGALLFGIQAGLGFVLASLMLSAVRERLYDKEVPAAFRGFPAVLIYIGLISMAVYVIETA